MKIYEIILIAVLLGILGTAMYKLTTTQKTQYLTLNQNEWICVKTEKYSTTVMIGKIPTVQTRSRCVNYIKE